MDTCTCGPHPHINLTKPYFEYHDRKSGKGVGNGTDGDSIDTIRQKIRNACASHGCFHVTIDTSKIASKTNESCSAANENSTNSTNSTIDAVNSSHGPSPIVCLAKANEEVEQDIESLFVPSFLEKAAESLVAPKQQHHNRTLKIKDNNSEEEATNQVLDWKQISNGRTLEVPSATFRGRLAESGDESQSTPEPKLSWEFQRCTNAAGNDDSADAASANHENDSNRTEQKMNQPQQVQQIEQGLDHLSKWTEALHSIAAVIVHLLGIPPNTVLREKSCCCIGSKTSNGESNQCIMERTTGKSHSCCNECNIDLLRVFRYDAIPPLRTKTQLGSSAHTDWGTLTVVWQDNKGGLQTFCHACNKWSDVQITDGNGGNDSTDGVDPSNSSRSSISSNSSNCVKVFVHVGDFLSLASCNEGIPQWPSPRHRVICPIQSNNSIGISDTFFDDFKSKSKECRRSLVYFTYPPPGVSLLDAQAVVSPRMASHFESDAQRNAPDNMNQNLKGKEGGGVYECYSLLHDQSQQSVLSQSTDKIASSVIENAVLDNDLGKANPKDEKCEVSLSAAYQNYQRIQHVSFDRVIFEKWDQVQRK